MVIVYRTLLIIAVLMHAVFGLAQQPADAPQESALVEGVVINAQNSRPIPRAEVSLQRVRGPQARKSTRTDVDGRFTFKNVDPGVYRLVADRQGFFSDSHKLGFQPIFEITSGANIKTVVQLMSNAVVAGNVLDEYSDPIQNVEVVVLSVRYRLGQMLLAPVGTGLTDDRGEYRISGLRPGKYYIWAKHKPPDGVLDLFPTQAVPAQAVRGQRATVARGANGGVQPGEPQDNVETASEPSFLYPQLFYPDTSDFLQAQQLPVSPGDEVRANFMFFAMPSVTIKGRVVNGLTGQPATSAAVSAYWTEYLEDAGVPAKVSPRDGTFEVRGVPPGQYTLRTSFTDESENFSDQRTVEVGNQGIQNVQLAALPDFGGRGHVTIEGPRRTAVNHVTIDFIAEVVAPRIRTSANRAEFIFDVQLHPQFHYHVNVPGLPEDYYLKSVILSGHDMPKDDVVVSGRRGDIELVLSPDGGHIEGTLFDDKDQPARGPVLLIPDTPKPGPAELFRRATADTKGKFALRGVSPGSYRLLGFARPDIDDVINDPDFQKSFANLGQKIIVDESGSYAVILKMVAISESNQ